MSSTPFNLASINVPDLTGMVVKGDKTIGSGSFADVWKGTYTQPSRVKVDVRRCTVTGCTHSHLGAGCGENPKIGLVIRQRSRRKDHQGEPCPRRFDSPGTLLLSLTFQKLLREARVWCTLHHSNVAQFVGIYYEKRGAYHIPCMVSRFYKRGTLKANLSNIADEQRLKFVCALSLLLKK